MKQIRGVKALAHDAVDQTVDLVGIGHEATARTVMRSVALAGAVIGPAAAPFALAALQADGLRRFITGTILGSVKGVNRLSALLSDAALDALLPDPGSAPEPEPLIPLRSDAMGTAGWAADALSGAVAGVIGDHLSAQKNSLDPGLSLRTSDAWIGADGSGIPADAPPRIAVLVHGLAATEWSWCMDAERLNGDPAVNFGSLLERDLGCTSIFVRYNTGRRIEENGSLLADRLAQLVACWPVPVEEILLIGHSMGGLVLRSACRIAHRRGAPWLLTVRRAVTLGTPHRGAPLAHFADLAGAALAALDLPATAITARIFDARSAGIKDLRDGDGAQVTGAMPPHISWCFVAAGIGPTSDHFLSRAFGDMLVQTDSASGPLAPLTGDALPASQVRYAAGIHHVAIQVHPDVYRIVRDFLRGNG